MAGVEVPGIDLVAIDLPPASPHAPPAMTRRVLARLRTVWETGRAALLLPPDPAAADRLVAALRPTARWPLAAAQPLPADPPGRPAPPGTAVVVATSGSTGQPKGVVLSHGALAASTRASLARLGAQPGDRFALLLPLEHVAGLQVVLRAWACGTDPVLPAVPAVPAVPARPPGDVEHVSLVPTQLARLLTDATATAVLARTRRVLVGGARLDPALAARAHDAGLPVVGSYGMSETGGGCVYDGRPLDDVEVALRADARVRLRGPVLLSGYRTAQSPLAVPTDAEGWLTTGDVGRWSPDGRLEVLARADDVIVSGGENVPAEAVAAALRALPVVADAAVIGRPDPEWGAVVTAVVVPRDPSAPPDLHDLRALLAGSLPRRWLPRRVVVVDELPLTPLGKVDGSRMRRLAAGDDAR